LKKGHYALTQPTIRPLFSTRQFQEALLKWTGNSLSYVDYIKETWGTSILGGGSFNKALHDGVYVGTIATEVEDTTEATEETETAVSNAVSALAKSVKSTEGLELTLYTKTGMGDGQQANNPWLQEFPDPITRTSWDNYLTVSKADAEALGLSNRHVATGALNGSYANVTVNGVTIKVPVLIQPGQAKGSVGLSFGYGRTAGLKEEMMTGVNAYALYTNFNNVQNV
ncbi:quinol:cytochrome C oxidoreductase, partial [Seonamhaeicola marinus]